MVECSARSLWRVVGELMIDHIFANARTAVASKLLYVLSGNLSRQGIPSDYSIAQMSDSDKLRLTVHGVIIPESFDQLMALRFSFPYNALTAASSLGLVASQEWLEEFAGIMVVNIGGPRAGTVSPLLVTAVVDAILRSFGHALELSKVYSIFGEASCGVLAADNRLCRLTSSLEEASLLVSSWNQAYSMRAFANLCHGAPSGCFGAADVRAAFLCTPLGKRALRHIEVYRFVRDSEVRSMGIADVALMGRCVDGKRRMLTWLVGHGVRFTLSSAAKVMKGHTVRIIQSGGIRDPEAFEIARACVDVGPKGVLAMLRALGPDVVRRVIAVRQLLESMVTAAWLPHQQEVREFLSKL
jgi:hypothetical protein